MLVSLKARSRGTRAIQAKNPRSKPGKERVSSEAERSAKRIFMINDAIFSSA
jgi:hypothetical protein